VNSNPMGYLSSMIHGEMRPRNKKPRSKKNC
jgi:hypothetical protein